MIPRYVIIVHAEPQSVALFVSVVQVYWNRIFIVPDQCGGFFGMSEMHESRRRRQLGNDMVQLSYELGEKQISQEPHIGLAFHTVCYSRR